MVLIKMKKKIILRFEPKKFNKKLLQIIALESQIAILKKENIKAFPFHDVSF